MPASVKVYNDIYVPTGFTPNNDGKNDQFWITAADGYQLLRFQVYNRWRQVVYNARDFSKGWDGKFNGVPHRKERISTFCNCDCRKEMSLQRKARLR